jgi:hypothetical protein
VHMQLSCAATAYTLFAYMPTQPNGTPPSPCAIYFPNTDILPGVTAAMEETRINGSIVMEFGHDKQEKVLKCTLTPGCSGVPGQSFVASRFSLPSTQVALNGSAPEQLVQKAMQADEREPLCSMSK